MGKPAGRDAHLLSQVSARDCLSHQRVMRLGRIGASAPSAPRADLPAMLILLSQPLAGEVVVVVFVVVGVLRVAPIRFDAKQESSQQVAPSPPGPRDAAGGSEDLMSSGGDFKEREED